MQITGYQMLNPGSTRGAVTDTFYRWSAGQVYTCPAVPVGEFAHMDAAVCVPIMGNAPSIAPQVVTASIEAPETRPVSAKRGRGKSE